ncbi:Cu-Zn family superoxide dismutase [Virgibacillus halotolerans]|uniref:superoxide dismutase family protein n=1 Tax=Virgibacillus halotolerans TaxID=1071053 RepID=UPI0019618BF6|nr:superoxide dismutase family protein [Virgibacillus halotolerans]MBM7600779.1 Cu-Zn family superoxide dismutase [Virgibacillus halotolerans]
MKRWIALLFVITLAVMISACSGKDDEQNTEGQNQNQGEDATESEDSATDEEEVLVSLNDADEEVVATATLTEDDKGVNVKLEGEGLPEGTHAFHIHEKGVCDPPDFESAGGHYNPEDKNHGKDDPEGPHAGDFDNIEVGEDGKVNEAFTTDQVTLKKGEENTLYTDEGTSLVIHADEDDYKSQPAGDAGDRIACGVIGE